MNKMKLLISIRNRRNKVIKKIDSSINPMNEVYLKGYEDGLYWVFNKVRNQRS